MSLSVTCRNVPSDVRNCRQRPPKPPEFVKPRKSQLWPTSPPTRFENKDNQIYLHSWPLYLVVPLYTTATLDGLSSGASIARFLLSQTDNALLLSVTRSYLLAQ